MERRKKDANERFAVLETNKGTIKFKLFEEK